MTSSPAPSESSPVSGAALGAAGGQMGGENFPVALRVLPREIRAHLIALYGYARRVDDLGDEFEGDRSAALDRVDRDLDRLFAAQPPEDPVVGRLQPTVRERGITEDPLRRLVQANRQDQVVARYATFGELRDYCHLSADPVGQLVLEVFGAATPELVELSNQICTALQVLEHLQDIAEDFARGRVYLPAADLDRFGVTDNDLAAPVGNTSLRGLVAFETARSDDLLTAGAPLVHELSGWARLAVAGYVAGGRATVRALRRSGYDPLPDPPRPRRTDTVLQTLRLLAVRPR